MSVLVKGMDMPEKCSECRMQTDEGFCSAMPEEFCGYVSDEKRSEWCPLVGVPETCTTCKHEMDNSGYCDDCNTTDNKWEPCWEDE